jgi:hypothetical protein
MSCCCEFLNAWDKNKTSMSELIISSLIFMLFLTERHSKFPKNSLNFFSFSVRDQTQGLKHAGQVLPLNYTQNSVSLLLFATSGFGFLSDHYKYIY